MSGAAPIAADACGALAPAAPAKKGGLAETTEGYPWASNHEVKKETNPFTDRDWRMLSYAWFGLAVRVLLVFGGIFSVVQFLSAREEKRVERSLQLVELWEAPDYQKAQRALKERLGALNANYASILGPNATEAERAVLLARIGEQALMADGGTMALPEFQEHFDRIVYFLNRLSFCVDSELCSRRIADGYFQDFASSFWGYFSGYILQQRRSGSPNYGAPIEKYVLRDQPQAAN